MIEPIVFDTLLVLFGGAGLATHGLVQAECAKHIVSVELDPAKHHLSKILNPTVEHIEANVLDLDADWIASFDAVWCSPECQQWSDQNSSNELNPESMKLLWWSLALPNDVLWVENVLSSYGRHLNNWGRRWNAAQFEQIPRQLRRRIVGGRYRNPSIYRKYKANYLEYADVACPAVLASELGHGGVSKDWYKERRKATRWYMDKYNRLITAEDMAYRQGFEIPAAWYQDASKSLLSTVIGNGVPVYFSRAFGEAYSKPKANTQLELFTLEETW